jgi:small subunit ribosomal protein S4
MKGDLCYKPACPIEKRGTQPPGQHGNSLRRGKALVGYGQQLREKQKVKRIYFILEGQFRNYFERAARMKGITGENLLFLLERRLDNAVYRAGFSTSRRQARQLVNHGHILVNDRKVDIPSYQVKPGDAISVREASRKNPHIEGAWQTASGRGRPSWISADGGDMAARIISTPVRDDIDRMINEQLIVELYSK